MVLEAWDDDAKVTYDRAMWSELVSLRFVEQARNAFILGPVGVGKTFLATALGHIACRRRISVHFERADRLHKRLRRRASTPATTTRCASSSASTCSIIDDFALQPLDAAGDGRHLRARASSATTPRPPC